MSNHNEDNPPPTSGGRVSIVSNNTNTGLYSGNVVIEFNTDQKVVKPVIKTNEKCTKKEVIHAVKMAKFALVLSKMSLENTEGAVIPDAISQVSTRALRAWLDYDDEVDDSPINRAREKEDNTERLYGSNDEILNRDKELDGHL